MTEIVIVGGGLAAEGTAKYLRREGFTGGITVFASEAHGLYQRPPLSKGFLAGKEDIDEVILHENPWYAEQDITVHTGTEVTAINRDKHAVTYGSGDTMLYDKLVLATGSHARTLPIPGHDLRGVHSLRTLDDSLALKEQLSAGGKRLVLIGSGWIGMEVAATARELGNEVTILERDPVPLAGALGAEIGRAFQRVHESHGVVFHTEASVEAIEGDGHVTGVRADGEVVDADLVLVGIGAAPNVQLAEAAGLDVDGGVVTNASMQTSDPDIYAVGDVASSYHPVLDGQIRSEHWQNAKSSAKVAAQALTGKAAQHDEIPLFFTDQFDIGMELSGYIPLMADAEIVVRGDLDSGKYLAFWVRDGRVVAGMNVNIWDVQDDIQRLIASGEEIDRQRLQNPDVPLAELIS